MSDEYRVIVSHPGKQHSFKTAAAVQKAGMLYKYITSVYYRPNSWTKILSDVNLKGTTLKKAKSHYCEELSDADVLQFREIFSLGTLALNKIPAFSKLYMRYNVWNGSCFYKKVMRYAVKNQVDAVIVYDGSSNKHFEILQNKDIIKIVDVSFASRQYLKDVFEKEISTYGLDEFRKLSYELENRKWLQNDLNTTQQADYFFVPSKFVMKSLEYCGVPKEKMYLIPYGVDLKKFAYMAKEYHEKDKINFIYVGEVTYRKGIHRLLNIISQNQKTMSIRLCGRIDKSLELYKKYNAYENIEFVGFVTHDKLAEEYRNADAFVFPTLGEGYGLVVLEALSCGLPVICSDRAGGNDIIEDSKNGFVVSMDNDFALTERLEWCVTHQKELFDMREHCRDSVSNCSWSNYESNLMSALNDIMKKGRNAK